MVLKVLKQRVARAYTARRSTAVIVGSLGRSGSLMLARACAQSLSTFHESRQSRNDAQRLVQSAWSLNVTTFQRSRVYKTHDYPYVCKAPPPFARFLYTYADPIDIVISLGRQREVRGLAWLKKHAGHMKAPMADLDRLYVEDVLALERHFDAWIGCVSLPLIAIRYDRLWEYQRLISDFIGFSLHLPPYVSRNSAISAHCQTQSDDIRRTYGRLRQKVALHSIYVSPVAVSLLSGNHAREFGEPSV